MSAAITTEHVPAEQPAGGAEQPPVTVVRFKVDGARHRYSAILRVPSTWRGMTAADARKVGDAFTAELLRVVAEAAQ
jgi:hypothetical protein